MRLLLTDREVDGLTRGYHRPLLAGLALAPLAWRLDGAGVLTAFMAIWLGACGGSLGAWRTERGLWMLAGLFLAIGATVYGLIQVGSVRDLLRGRRAPAWLTADMMVGTGLLGLQVRLLLTVASRNRALGGRGGPGESGVEVGGAVRDRVETGRR